jgi:cleavage stimulation factor subunit 3
METDADAMKAAESIFSRSLFKVPNVKLWNTYLDYVRRINNINTDTTGNAVKVVLQAFDFVLKNIGMDPSSGFLWQEYINFVKSQASGGVLGGGSWADLQKGDEIRKAYQRAVVVPTRATNAIWQEYQKFENDFNKTTVSIFRSSFVCYFELTVR